jgi:chitinase
VTASASNVAPVANPGAYQSVVLGPVILDGSASSDANGDTLTYKWVLIAKPIGSSAVLSSETSAKPSFTADIVGVYVASLVVSDGKLPSDIKTTAVTAAAANVAPIANAGPYQNVVTGTTATLNGKASSDANGDTLTYKWFMISRPLNSNAALSSDTGSNPSFVADLAGTYVFSLQVSDGKLFSPLSYVTVTAGAANLAPVANAGSAQTVVRGATVTLDGSGSTDANGDTLIYTWTMTFRPSSSSATLGTSSINLIKPTFVPDVAGVYVFTLMVNDGVLNSGVATVAVTATAP